MNELQRCACSQQMAAQYWNGLQESLVDLFVPQQPQRPRRKFWFARKATPRWGTAKATDSTLKQKRRKSIQFVVESDIVRTVAADAALDIPLENAAQKLCSEFEQYRAKPALKSAPPFNYSAERIKLASTVLVSEMRNQVGAVLVRPLAALIKVLFGSSDNRCRNGLERCIDVLETLDASKVVKSAMQPQTRTSL